MTTYRVRKIGRTWNIFKGTILVDGGYFNKLAAFERCHELNYYSRKNLGFVLAIAEGADAINS